MAIRDKGIVLLPDRGIVEVEGVDAADFLQSLVTNDIDQAAPDRAIFAGLLTPQGKIVFDFLIYSPRENLFWLDAPAEIAADLAKRLTLYKLRAKVAVTDRSAEMVMGVGTPGNGETPVASLPDPRHAEMPRRHVLAAGGGQEPGLEDYHAARIALCVPEGNRDYLYGEVFPHEVCYDLLGGVDFYKGCYVGQEVVSRMHHRGAAKTRITGVQGDPPLPPRGTEITAGEQPVGQLLSSSGAQGIALIRLDRAEEAVGTGIPFHAGEATLTLRRPVWATYDVPTT